MRDWMRPWLATAVLLGALGGATSPVSGSVAAAPADADVAGVQNAAPAPCQEPGPGPLPGTLAMARPPASFLCDAPLDDPVGPLAFSFGHRGARPPRAAHAAAGSGALGAERARILLRSLTLPGWGQATLGRRNSAVFFGLTETAIWGTFAAFRIQVAMREDAFMRTARIQAGIDLGGRDEEWRRIVGGYSSSEEYNRLVVAWDAARLYLSDPAALDYDSYYAYIEAHRLRGADTWSWSSVEAQGRYRELRKESQRAARRANTTLAVAVVNRIVSALQAARASGHPARAAHSWQFEVVPTACEDATAFQFRVRARF
jgi:hypothetical protein